MLPNTVDVERLVDERKLSGYHFFIILLGFLVMIVDGIDVNMGGFVGPGIAREFHVSPAALGGLFSAGLVAGLIGTPLFGMLADRFGRKWVIVLGVAFFGVFTLASVVANAFSQVVALRFLAGIAVAGVMPTTVALTSEFAPRRFRATMVSLMFAGQTLGGVAAGLVAQAFVATLGWRILFWVGGLAPIVLCFALVFLLPESLHYLLARPQARDRLAAALRRLDPGLRIDDRTTFMVGRRAPTQKMKTSALFAGRLAVITPLIWVANLVSLMVFFFASSWLPTLLATSSVGAGHAAFATSLFLLGGTIGGLCLMRLLDRFGFLPVSLLFFCAAPAVVLIGLPGLGSTALLSAISLAGFCLYGLQFGLVSMEGPLFPPPVRGRGLGFCFAAARIGATAGPIVGGLLLARHLPVPTLFALLTIPLGLGGLVTAVITPLYRKQVLEASAPVEGAAQAQLRPAVA